MYSLGTSTTLASRIYILPVQLRTPEILLEQREWINLDVALRQAVLRLHLYASSTVLSSLANLSEILTYSLALILSQNNGISIYTVFAEIPAWDDSVK